MKVSLIFLVLALPMITEGGLAQYGDPVPVPPPTVEGSANFYEGGQMWVNLEGTLILNNLGASPGDRVGFLRNLAGCLLQTSAVGLVPWRSNAFEETLTASLASNIFTFDAVPDNFFDDVTDFLVTDGGKYFRIVLDLR